MVGSPYFVIYSSYYQCMGGCARNLNVVIQKINIVQLLHYLTGMTILSGLRKETTE
jgi:hypothetical protein